MKQHFFEPLQIGRDIGEDDRFDDARAQLDEALDGAVVLRKGLAAVLESFVECLRDSRLQVTLVQVAVSAADLGHNARGVVSQCPVVLRGARAEPPPDEGGQYGGHQLVQLGGGGGGGDESVRSERNVTLGDCVVRNNGRRLEN